MKLLATLSSLVAVATAAAWDPNYDESQIGQPLPKIPVDPEQKAAYFVNDGYVFALNQVVDGDVYFHMNAPTTHAWMGIGFGSEMKNAFMIVSYVGADGVVVINSPRIADGHSEPTLVEGVTIEGVYNDAYAPFPDRINPKGAMIAHAVCRNCSIWATGALDLTSTAQPFIYALGAKKNIRSNALDADLNMHEFHGSFTLDMTKAVNSTGTYGRVPYPQSTTGPAIDDFAFENFASSAPYQESTDQDWGTPVHAVFMCLAFILIFPLGAVLLRLAGKVRWHMYAQVTGFVFVIIGFGTAIHISRLYNRSKHFNSAHQVIGLLIFAAMFIQLGLGLVHHTMFKRTKTPTMMGQVHRFLGIFIVLLGMINGGLGLNLASDDHYAVAYGVIVGIVGVVFLLVTSLVLLYRRKHKYEPEKPDYVPEDNHFDAVTEPPAAYEMRNGYSYSVSSPTSAGFPRFQRIGSDMKDPFDEESAVDGDSPIPTSAKGRWESVPL
ncbi:iron reductase domain protein, partial [Polychaeton citri CBS 116435]